jgi:tetratricopeptide (TPR) repeat protein
MKISALLLLFFSLSFATSFLEEIEEGVYFYKQKQYERALEIFDRVLINHPNSKRARLEYARVLFAMGRYEESKKEFLIVLNQNPPPLVKKNIKWL